MEIGMYQVEPGVNQFIPAIRSGGETIHLADGAARKQFGLALEQSSKELFRALSKFEGEVELVTFSHIAVREDLTGVVNCTPHTLNLLDEDGEEVAEIPPTGLEVRVQTSREKTDEINGIPVFETETGDVTGLPEPHEGLIFVVSGFAAGVADREDVFSPGKLVRDDAGNPIGAKGLSR